MVQLEQSNGSLPYMRDYLRHLKRNLNIPQNNIYEIWADIRSEVKSDDFDNFVLEVIDLASGWCLSIWGVGLENREDSP